MLWLFKVFWRLSCFSSTYSSLTVLSPTAKLVSLSRVWSMKIIHAFTLIELLVTVGIILLLAAIATPSLLIARQKARQISCCAQLHQIGSALATYQAASHFRFPPFSFSDIYGNLPLSGHWGGPIQADPTIFGRAGIGPDVSVNLWALVQGNMLPAQALACPSASQALHDDGGSMFNYTNKFSTYCLRFPPSSDLFDESLDLENFNHGKLLDVYLMYCSGQDAPIQKTDLGAPRQVVPALRLNKTYKLDSNVISAKQTFDPARDAIVADMFWWQDMPPKASIASKKYRTFSVEGRWCHQSDFNVLFGGGSVHTICDGGIIRDNSLSAGQELNNDGLYFARYGERVWQYFDTTGK